MFYWGKTYVFARHGLDHDVEKALHVQALSIKVSRMWDVG